MAPDPDRREFSRLAASPDTRCDLTIDHRVIFRALAVENVSPSGVRLRVDIAVPPGNVLNARLEDAARAVVCSRLVRVVYCYQEAGAYRLGGFFGRGIHTSDVEAIAAP